MKKFLLMFYLLHLAALCFSQNAEIDSILQMHESPGYILLSDSTKADICRRLAIDNIRKSTETAFSYASEYYDISTKMGSATDEAIALNLIGVCRVSEGNLEKGLEYYLQSLAIRKKIGDTKMISNTTNNIGTVYIRLGRYDQGLDYYARALEIRKANNDREGMAQTLNNIGVTNKILGNYDTAIAYLDKSLIIKRQLGDKELIASSLNNLGEIAAMNGDEALAMAYFNESLSCRKSIDDIYGMSKTLVSISDYLAGEGKYTEALKPLQQALTLLIPGFSDTSALKNPDPALHQVDYNTVIILKNKAEIFRDMYQRNQQVADLERCLDVHILIIEFIDQIRMSYKDEKSKLYLMQNNRDLYSDAITTSIKLLYATGDRKYKARAFELAERGKARILLDMILDSEVKAKLGISDSLLLAEADLKKEIAMLEKQKYDLSAAGLQIPDSITGALFNTKRQLDANDLMVRKQFPEYDELRNTLKNPLMPDVQKVLNDDEIFLQYHLADSILYAFIITSDQNNIIEVALQPDFYDQLEFLQEFLTSGAGNDFGKVNENFVVASHRLYEHLVYPVEQFHHSKKFIIIPDGPLFYIPFGVLLTDMPDSPESYKDLPYLINQHPISYNYSASMLMNSLSKETSTESDGLIAFALSFKKQNYTYSKTYFDQFAERGSELSELPGVKAEVENILNIISGEAYFDSLATEQKFKHPERPYGVIHVATHGIIDNDRPMFSKLVFAPDAEDDGNLYTWELFNMKMNAEMAVLSACNTGYGKLQLGEGMMTLARGFLYAGIPALVISLWNVNDASTSIVMTNFYRNLSEGNEKSEALQMAKKEYLENCDKIMANPYFWGGFIQLGNTSELSFGKKSKILFYYLAAGIFLILILLFLKSRLFRS